ncbi:hypothetical protein LIER_12785 [Lithospermum erythrorhizon]|uniref:Uncharacterized protein n=1 Tax=Lithospermum erythrorhizon TaxID=34254 RepID=A0AAV3PUH6_LITER
MGFSWKIRDKVVDCILATYVELLQKTSKAEAYISEKEQFFNSKEQKKRKEFGGFQTEKSSSGNVEIQQTSIYQGTKTNHIHGNTSGGYQLDGRRSHPSNECYLKKGKCFRL